MATQLPPPEYQVGQRVRVVLSERNRTEHIGTIERIIWHHKDGRYNYYLNADGKKISKRYISDDLCPVGSLTRN
jgi:hypothetical protein